MRKLIVFVFIILLCTLCYRLTGKHNISIVNAHYDGSTAKIIVDKLPLTEAEKIGWWQKNQHSVLEKYNIPTDDKSPFLIVIYAFGNGYQVEGKEDRLCFPDITPPKNCIDKNILMTIWRARDGSVKYQF